MTLELENRLHQLLGKLEDIYLIAPSESDCEKLVGSARAFLDMLIRERSDEDGCCGDE